jgi:quinol monooxygenase YgiN
MTNKPDTTILFLPMFKVNDRASFNAAFKTFYDLTKSEKGMVNYGFATHGEFTVCRESYVDAEAILLHLKNVNAPLQEALKVMFLFVCSYFC